ncbi:MAG: amino acid ABC transporter permease [Pleurocapsa minor GSE-CHR-MK-17-07R]|jgi:polar amino acid transport system permease protein|nr:amino acid ABC transporter permease [Pleurocapsa minor GSE-CHR-MK 17-07R]
MTSAVTDARPAPRSYKRNLLINRLSRAPWWLLMAFALIFLFAQSVSGDITYQRVFEQVRQGIWTTIWVTVVAYSIALVAGLIIAILRRSRNPVVYQLVTLYVEVVRGIPTLVLVYYVVLAVTPEAVRLIAELSGNLSANGVLTAITGPLSELRARDIDNAARAIIGLSISYSAFLSEVFRAGIESIDHGQLEAGASLGLTRWQTMRLIVLPQALRAVTPPLANDFIAMLKESSLVSIVGVQDITRQGSTFASANFRFFESYNVVALTYLVLTLSLSMAVKGVETWVDRGKKRNPS